jgi:hypothetical protein
VGLVRTAGRSVSGEIPELPVFEEPIEQVQVRVEAVIGRTDSIENDLEHHHPAVAGMLAKDAERRAAAKAQTHASAWDKPLYDTPIQERRMKLDSAILLTVARCSCRARPGGRLEMTDAAVVLFTLNVVAATPMVLAMNIFPTDQICMPASRIP